MIIDKLFLSDSVNGMGISVAVTGSPGTAVHTAVASGANGDMDECWVYAQNNHTADVALTVEYGSSGTSDYITQTLTTKAGLTCIVPGLLLNNGTFITAFADVASVITILGFVNRITK